MVLAGGCSRSASTGAVTVGFVNSTDQSRTVHVEIRRTGTVVWSRRADVPPDGSDHPTPTVETKRALTDIEEGAQLEVEAWLDDRRDVASKSLTIEDVNENPEEYVTIRVWGRNDPRVEIST